MAPRMGFWVDPPGAPSLGVYGAQTGANKLGQYYAWNRIYDVNMGRWTTPDSVELTFWNLFDYVGGVVLQTSDPTGLAEKDPPSDEVVTDVKPSDIRGGGMNEAPPAENDKQTVLTTTAVYFVPDKPLPKWTFVRDGFTPGENKVTTCYIRISLKYFRIYERTVKGKLEVWAADLTTTWTWNKYGQRVPVWRSTQYRFIKRTTATRKYTLTETWDGSNSDWCFGKASEDDWDSVRKQAREDAKDNYNKSSDDPDKSSVVSETISYEKERQSPCEGTMQSICCGWISRCAGMVLVLAVVVTGCAKAENAPERVQIVNSTAELDSLPAGITELWVNGQKISAKDLDRIPDKRGIRRLVLTSIKCDNDACSQAATFSDLTDLTFAGIANVDSTAIARLGKLNSLANLLFLSGEILKETVLVELAALPNLKTLTVHGARTNDKALTSVIEKATVVTLILSGLKDCSLRALANATPSKTLTDLMLYGLSNEWMERDSLLAYKNLPHLVVYSTKPAPLSFLNELSACNCSFGFGIGTLGSEEWQGKLANVGVIGKPRSVILAGSGKISTDLINALGNSENLVELELVKVEINASQLTSVLSKRKTLKVSLVGCKGLTDDEIAQIRKGNEKADVSIGTVTEAYSQLYD